MTNSFAELATRNNELGTTNSINKLTTTNAGDVLAVTNAVDELTMTNFNEEMIQSPEEVVQSPEETIQVNLNVEISHWLTLISRFFSLQNESYVDTSAGSVPDYESSAETTNEPLGKRIKVEKNYLKVQEFANSQDAEEFIKKEVCWSKHTSKSTVWGEKDFYRCNKAQLRGKQCDSGAYLLYDAMTPQVFLYVSSNDHSCGKDGNAAKRIPMAEETKAFIEATFRDGARGRKQIERKLAKAKIPLCHRNQLNNFLSSLKKKVCGPTKISLTDLEQFLVKHSEVPEDLDEPYVVNHFVDYNTAGGNFRCFISTRNLLKNAINRESKC